MDPLSYLFIYLGLVIGGVLIEIVFSQIHFFFTKRHYKKYHFSIGRYFQYLLFPLLGVLFVFLHLGNEILIIFFLFAILGTFLEWLVGFSYHMVLGTRLWTYNKYSLTRYTSILSIPLWGLLGILFYLLVKVFN